MNIVAIVLQVLLGVAFLGAGASKMAGAQTQVKNFDRWRLPQGWRPIVGLVELIGALGLLVGVVLPWVAAIAAVLLVVVMLGALLTHVRIRDVAQHFVPPAVLLCLAASVVVLQWSALVGHFI